MKIKINKIQWEKAGLKAGLIKSAKNKIGKDMENKVNAFFSPSITLKRHVINGKIISGFWYVDLVKDIPLARQFIEEASIKSKYNSRISDSDLDAFEMAAGKHGYSVETIGD